MTNKKLNMNKDQIRKVSVVGAGQIGPDIALHFAKSLSGNGTQVIVLDISESALEKARNKVWKKIDRGVETGAFKPEQAAAIKSSLQFTNDYNEVRNSELVVEAATEDENIKNKIFSRIELLTDEKCIYLSNSSHMQPEVIFRNIKDKSRCLVAHYFFPAEINPVIEIVPGGNSSEILTTSLLNFYESIGKVPIRVRSSYGYAIDPIFEGLCQTAILCLEKGWGNEKEIDAAAVKALGLGVGPFTALNLTGGNPITAHGLDECHKLLMPWFRTPGALHDKNNKKENWNTALRGEKIDLDPAKENILINEFRGAYFALASYILGRAIVDINDLNIATELSLVIKPPFTFMNEIGIGNAFDLAEQFCNEHKSFPFPALLKNAKETGGWKLSDITIRTESDVLVITIRRPKALNALNLNILRQIQNALEEVENNSVIKGAVITGFGVKAFVSGADIGMLASLKTPEEGFDNSQTFQSVLNYIESYSKPVVCAMNGFAFGGGNELAMACTARICRKGLSVLVCQPEVNLGFIPGAGGTQRLPRIAGIDKAAEILRTGRAVSCKEAEEIGLIYKRVEGNLVAEAVSLVKDIAAGKLKIQHCSKEPLPVNASPASLNLGHLSRKIDDILVKAIYEGSKLNLREGLKLESKMFAECMKTEDMKIGLDNFKNNGPKAKAVFVHH